MHRLSQFQDPTQPLGVTPISAFGLRIQYHILEYSPLIDSSNMNPDHWVQIAEDITAHYAQYDAFVILHGTDTMSWTAAALSFMLVNLSKTVVLTGSQISLSEVRNDAVDNLLGAITIAGHYDIPEVCLFFHETLYRGNRTRKVDAWGLDAFASHNLPPLAKLGIEIDVAWHRIRPASTAPIRLRKITERNIAILRLFPGIPLSVIKNILAPPLRGLVLETFGSGNAPNNRPDLLACLAEATKRGIIIVNCTQCERGTVSTDYATGTDLAEIGVLPGGDMTTEAALTKLAYLLSLNLPAADLKKLVSTNLRGEMTPGKEQRFSFRERQFVASVTQVLTQGRADPEVERAIYPVLLCAAGSQGDNPSLKRMIKSGVNLSASDYDGRTALHLAASEGHVQTVQLLLEEGSDIHAIDRWGATPLRNARQNGHNEVIDLLLAHGAQE